MNAKQKTTLSLAQFKMAAATHLFLLEGHSEFAGMLIRGTNIETDSGGNVTPQEIEKIKNTLRNFNEGSAVALQCYKKFLKFLEAY